MNKLHLVKCQPDRFHAIGARCLDDGATTPDRDYQLGDVVLLIEVKAGRKTGEVMAVRITSVDRVTSQPRYVRVGLEQMMVVRA